MRLPSFPLIERIAAGSLRVWLIIGILLRVTKLRDTWDLFRGIYYTTPWPAIAAGMLVLALHARRLRHAHHVRRYLILTGGALFVWIALSWQSGPALSEHPALRLVEWNTAHPQHLFGPVTGWLEAQNADLLVIAEASHDAPAAAAEWQKRFPGYQVSALDGEMMCLARGDLETVESGLLAPGSYYALHHARIRGVDYIILQADITNIGTRLPALQRLTEIAQAHIQEKLIVVGDFNTPRESKGFDELRQLMKHSFETVGSGIAETWPTWGPALSLDHVWSSPSLPPRACQIAWPMWSDHRPVIVEF